MIYLVSKIYRRSLLRKTLMLILLFFSSVGFTEEIMNVKTFNINSGIFPPYTTEDRNGFEDRLAKELYKRLGFKIIFNKVPGERGLLNLNQGLDDGLLSRIAGLEKKYQNILPIMEEAVEWRFVAFTNKKDVKINSWRDFEAYDVAYLTGWKIFDINIKKYRSLTRVNKAKQLFKLLDHNRVDVVVYALQPGKWFIKTLGIDGVHDLQPALAIKKKYFYVHKKHKELIPRAIRILKSIKKDGTYKKLYKATIGSCFE